MSFKDELKAITRYQNPQGLEKLKRELQEAAARKQNSLVTKNYNQNTLDFLDKEGLRYTETKDIIEGNFLTITW